MGVECKCAKFKLIVYFAPGYKPFEAIEWCEVCGTLKMEEVRFTKGKTSVKYVYETPKQFERSKK
jgi:hypothetical protein